MNFLITGAAGFIGSNYCQIMTNKYENDLFVGFDKLTYAGNLKNLDPILNKKNFIFIKGDITNKKDVQSVFEKYKIDVVINFAAESHVDRSIENPNIFIETNVLGTLTLLDESLKHNITRFHQVSTDEVYGDLPLDRPDLKFTENNPINPSSPYSASKASADLIVLSYFRTFNAPVTISRCSNNYGPYQFPEKLIPLMILNAENDKPLPVYGDGLNVRDWLYVEDHCCAIDTIVRHAKNGSVYNIGGGVEKANIEIVKTIIHELKKSENLIKYVEDRKGHDRRYAIDESKIARDLGYKPQYSFESAIKNTIQWYISNKDWLNSIINGEYLRFTSEHYKI